MNNAVSAALTWAWGTFVTNPSTTGKRLIPSLTTVTSMAPTL